MGGREMVDEDGRMCIVDLLLTMVSGRLATLL